MGHEVTTKPEEWSKDLDYSADMHDYIHNKLTVFENSIKSGFKDGKWYPHESLEGGRKTIAYGHKLKGDESFDKGLTEEDAKSLLVKDTLEAYRRAFNSYKNKYGLKEWNKLSNKAKIALTDLSFNIGNTKDYEEAFYKRDVKEIKKLINKRGYKPEGGGTNSLDSRNQSIIDNYISTDDWSFESNAMKQWLMEDNPLA
tara:strand:- start:1014 stop:1610 length:597 start_codon:yes stop_codon:yes gene_type:complete